MTPTFGGEARRIRVRSPDNDGMKRRILHASGSLARWTSFTRHGVLASARRFGSPILVPPARTTLVLTSGSVLIGAGVASFRAADLGLPPYDVLLSAISSFGAMTHGQAGWALAALLMGVAVLLGERLVAGSLVLVFASGLSVDAASELVGSASGGATRVIVFLFGLVLLSSGLALVVFSGKGRGPFEMLMAAGAARGYGEARVRTILEVSVLGIGIGAGGDFGIGTVVFAVSIGPLLTAMIQALADHRVGRTVRQATPVH